MLTATIEDSRILEGARERDLDRRAVVATDTTTTRATAGDMEGSLLRLAEEGMDGTQDRTIARATTMAIDTMVAQLEGVMPVEDREDQLHLLEVILGIAITTIQADEALQVTAVRNSLLVTMSMTIALLDMAGLDMMQDLLMAARITTEGDQIAVAVTTTIPVLRKERTMEDHWWILRLAVPLD